MRAGDEARAGALLGWYARGHRPLPWRATRDPWALLVSEVMLQQTQAARVVPYYERFLARFPEPAALAGAPAREVLAAWSGLGYNRRALALQRAARVVAEEGWPPPERLVTLPAVGPYTAAAVASFAWDVPVAAVDTNVKRVLERWDGERRGPAGLRARAAELLPAEEAAAWNQALMELGAMVCVARRPRCRACPVRAWCATRGELGPGPGPGPGQLGPKGTSARRPRFEETDRWARGRILAALVAGEPPPAGLTPERSQRALEALERDGLLVRSADGVPGLP